MLQLGASQAKQGTPPFWRGLKPTCEKIAGYTRRYDDIRKTESNLILRFASFLSTMLFYENHRNGGTQAAAREDHPLAFHPCGHRFRNRSLTCWSESKCKARVY